MLKNSVQAHIAFFSEISHTSLPAVIDWRKKIVSFLFIYHLRKILSQNDNNSIPLEREIIQEEIETKIKVLAFIYLFIG